MKSLYKAVFILTCIWSFNSLSAQIVVNGRSPVRYNSTGPENSISVSYGTIFWVDGKNVPLNGSSASRQMYRGTNDIYSVERMNTSFGVNVGYEKALSHKLAIRAAFSTAKLITGVASRADLITTDESKFTQLGLYSRYTLTKEPNRRFQFQWLAGPELIYAKKDILVEDYVDGSAGPSPYRQDISILEGAVVTGLGMSVRLSNAFSLFSDAMLGISLPGKGLKMTNSGFGLKYNW